jgi:hypothetical protein
LSHACLATSFPPRLTMSNPELPATITKNGRKYFIRHQFENYKRALAGLPLIDENGVSVIELVPAPQAAEELGQSRRTLGRRMVAGKTGGGATSTAA